MKKTHTLYFKYHSNESTFNAGMIRDIANLFKSALELMLPYAYKIHTKTHLMPFQLLSTRIKDFGEYVNTQKSQCKTPTEQSHRNYLRYATSIS